MKLLSSMILWCSIVHYAMAQSAMDTSTYARSTVFASGLGNGLLYSLNWDHRWSVGDKRWMSVSGGASVYVACDDPRRTCFPLISVPIQWNWFRGRVHHREHGAGLTYGSAWYTGESVNGEPLASQGIYLMVKPIGYRLQREDGGLFIRTYVLAFGRVMELNRRYVEAYGYWESSPVIPWLGLDLGYTFKQRNRGARP